MKIAFALLCMLYTTVSIGQTTFSIPKYRTCPTIYSCEDGTRPLKDTQLEELHKLEKIITPGSTSDVISKVLQLKLDSVTPAVEVIGSPQLGRVRKATWYTTGKQSSILDPHVDVYFSNEKAAWFKWYFEGFAFAYVEVSYVKK